MYESRIDDAPSGQVSKPSKKKTKPNKAVSAVLTSSSDTDPSDDDGESHGERTTGVVSDKDAEKRVEKPCGKS